MGIGELVREPAAAVVVEVLLEVVRSAGICPAAEHIAARLAARGVGVTAAQIEAVYSRHGLKKRYPRTNNQLESLFHDVKHGERRRSGRKILTQDFEQLALEAALVQNLSHADDVSIVSGSLQELPQAFAQLDRQ